MDTVATGDNISEFGFQYDIKSVSPEEVVVQVAESQLQQPFTIKINEEVVNRKRSITYVKFEDNKALLEIKRVGKALEQGKEYILKVGEGGFVEEDYISLITINEGKATFDFNEGNYPFTLENRGEFKMHLKTHFTMSEITQDSVKVSWYLGPD